MAERTVVFSFHHAPYGTIYYTEGLRAAVGATSGIDEHKVHLVYMGDGVYYTLKGVDRTDAQKYLNTLVGLGVKPYVEEEALAERAVAREDLAGDVEVIPRSKILDLYKNADLNVDF
jgi:sulfur relay (sulfurtransferase) DsrF/TusC family protein